MSQGTATDHGYLDTLTSVILPVRDRVDSVGDAIRSVLAQTHDHLELIVVDDGSTDGTREVLEAFDDPRLRIIEGPGAHGVSAARNAGIDQARGRYLAFQDSDDLWAETMLEHQLRHLSDAQTHMSPLVGVICCRGRIEGTEIIEGPSFGPGPFDSVDLLTGALRERTPMVLLDRTVTDDLARFDPELPAVVERDFLLSAMGGGALFIGTDEVLLTIRRGRADHVAQPTRAAAAYRQYLVKYRTQLAQRPDIDAWYRYLALYESLRARDRRSAIRHLRYTVEGCGWRVVPHALAGLVAGRIGIAAANRVLPIRGPRPRGAALANAQP